MFYFKIKIQNSGPYIIFRSICQFLVNYVTFLHFVTALSSFMARPKNSITQFLALKLCRKTGLHIAL